MAHSDKFKIVLYIVFGSTIYAIYQTWKFPFDEMFIYNILIEPTRIKLYLSLLIIITAFIIYPYLAIRYEFNLRKEFKSSGKKGENKKNRYSNISLKEDNKSWGDVIEEAKNKKRDDITS